MGCLGAPEAWGPWARAHWIRRPWVARTWRTTERWPCAAWADGRCPLRAVSDWLVSRGEVVGVSTRLSLVWRWHEGRENIRSWTSAVADWYGVSSHVKGVSWFWKQCGATLCAGEMVVSLPAVSQSFHLEYRRGCCDGISNLAFATTAAVWWWSPLTFRIRRRIFLAGQDSDNGSDVISVKCSLDSR